MPSTRALLRLARRIYTVYEHRAAQFLSDNRPNWPVLTDYFHEIGLERRLISIARDRGWHLAASQHSQCLRRLFRQFTQIVRDSQTRWVESDRQQLSPTLQDLFLDLQHLFAEFDKVFVDPKKTYVAVHTDAIELEGIELGRFSIRLNWPRLAKSADADCFEVIALDPHPSSLDEDVTHPHVKSRKLCAGDATLPLKKALEQGRLTDAFHLVRSVLDTYNPDSAHVKLNDWEGRTCWECGCSTYDYERRSCEHCYHEVCAECSTYCEHCETDRCTSCRLPCGVCEERCCPCRLKKSTQSPVVCCPNCRSVCAGCDAEVATKELDDATDLCRDCLDRKTRNRCGQLAATLNGESL